MTEILMEASRARLAWASGCASFAKIRPRDLKPQLPAIAEPPPASRWGSPREKDGEGENGITREEQDRIAYLSHRNAAAATESGRLAPEMCTVLVPPRYETAVAQDNLIRREHLAGGAGRAASRLRSQSTAPSPPATPRPSPTAPPPCS